jgi:hypothetical protein
MDMVNKPPPSGNFLLELEQILTDATGNPMYSYSSLGNSNSTNDPIAQEPPNADTDQGVTGSWGVPIDSSDLDQSSANKAEAIPQDT